MYALIIIAASLVSPGAQTATVVESIEPSHHAECVQAAAMRSNEHTLTSCVSTDGARKLLAGCKLVRTAHVDSATGISEADDLAGYALEQYECAR
jgi:hypothetical protein